MPSKKLKQSHRWQAYALLLLNTIIWGAAFVVVKPAFDVTSPLRFLFYRHAIAAIFTLPLLWYYRTELLSLGRTFWTVVILELLGSPVALALLYAGLNYTTVLEANLLGSALPLFITLGGIFILKEKQERHEWLGLFIALAATVFLTVAPYYGQLGAPVKEAGLGNVLIIVSHLVNLFYFPLAKRAYRALPKFLVTTISFWVASIAFFYLSFVEAGASLTTFQNLVQLDFTASSVWVASGYMAILGSIIGLTAYIKGQDLIEASEASFFYYLQPLVYLPLTYLIFGQSISLSQFLALLTILIGIAIAERRRAPSKK